MLNAKNFSAKFESGIFSGLEFLFSISVAEIERAANPHG